MATSIKKSVSATGAKVPTVGIKSVSKKTIENGAPTEEKTGESLNKNNKNSLSWAEEFNFIVTERIKKVDLFKLKQSEVVHRSNEAFLKSKEADQKNLNNATPAFFLSISELKKIFCYSMLSETEKVALKSKLSERVEALSTESVLALGMTLTSVEKSKLSKEDYDFRNEILSLLTKSFKEATGKKSIDEIREHFWRSNLGSAIYHQDKGEKTKDKLVATDELKSVNVETDKAQIVEKVKITTKDEKRSPHKNGDEIWVNRLSNGVLGVYFSKKELALKGLLEFGAPLKKESVPVAFHKYFAEKVFKSSKFSKNALNFLETIGAISTDEELCIRTKSELTRCRTQSTYRYRKDFAKKNIDALKLLLYCMERQIELKDLMIGKKNPIEIVMTHAVNAGFDNFPMNEFLKKANSQGWFNNYKGIHPVWALVNSFCKTTWNGGTATDGKDSLEFLHSIGFKVDGSVPDGCKVSMPIVSNHTLLTMVCQSSPYLMASGTGVKKNFGVFFLQTFLDLCITSGVDLNKPNGSGIGALRYLNMGIKRPYYSAEQHQVLEQAFEKLVGAGARLETLLPQKDIKQIAGSEYIKRLIEAHMEKMELIASLDRKYLDKALEMVNKMKAEDEKKMQENSANKKTMRL